MTADPSLNPKISEGEVFLTREESQVTLLNDEEEAIPAIPINYYDPNKSNKEGACATIGTQKRKNVGQHGESSSCSKRGRRCKTLPPEWEANWSVDYKQRTNRSGRIDKHYTHKATNFKCRSIVEVEKYEKKVKERVAIEENDDGLHVDGKLEVGKEEDVNTKQMSVNVDEFLAEAHYNLLHKFNP